MGDLTSGMGLWKPIRNIFLIAIVIIFTSGYFINKAWEKNHPPKICPCCHQPIN